MRMSWLQVSWYRHNDCWEEFIARRGGDFFWCFLTQGNAMGVFVAALVWGWR